MQLFRFANPDYLYLLLLVPVIILLFIANVIRRRKALKRLGDLNLVEKLIPEMSGARPVVKIVLQFTAFVAAVIMLARPQFGSRMEDVKKQGVEVIIALDVSNSMLAEDIQPDRLTRAKQAITRLIDNLDNDRIGLIVFAGDAYTQIPVTTDYISAKMFLATIGPEMVPKQGTSIGAAINWENSPPPALSTAMPRTRRPRARSKGSKPWKPKPSPSTSGCLRRKPGWWPTPSRGAELRKL